MKEAWKILVKQILHEGPCKVWMEVPTLMILVKQILH
jgi:hypothetical protein